jgi:lactoylglutathione lyase
MNYSVSQRPLARSVRSLCNPRSPVGIELNLVLNASKASEPNVLMDVPEKHPGITHFALLCPDIMATKNRLEAAGIPLSGGPVR